MKHIWIDSRPHQHCLILWVTPETIEEFRLLSDMALTCPNITRRGEMFAVETRDPLWPASDYPVKI